MAHWEHRDEAKWKEFRFNQPYAKGLKRLREDVLARTDFDPATLWQWVSIKKTAIKRPSPTDRLPARTIRRRIRVRCTFINAQSRHGGRRLM